MADRSAIGRRTDMPFHAVPEMGVVGAGHRNPRLQQSRMLGRFQAAPRFSARRDRPHRSFGLAPMRYGCARRAAARHRSLSEHEGGPRSRETSPPDRRAAGPPRERTRPLHLPAHATTPTTRSATFRWTRWRTGSSITSGSWHSAIGTLLLYSALTVHASLGAVGALRAPALSLEGQRGRSSWCSVSPSRCCLTAHVVAERIALELYGIEQRLRAGAAHVLGRGARAAACCRPSRSSSPGFTAASASIFWLRLKRFFRRAAPCAPAGGGAAADAWRCSASTRADAIVVAERA